MPECIFEVKYNLILNEIFCCQNSATHSFAYFFVVLQIYLTQHSNSGTRTRSIKQRDVFARSLLTGSVPHYKKPTAWLITTTTPSTKRPCAWNSWNINLSGTFTLRKPVSIENERTSSWARKPLFFFMFFGLFKTG